MENSRKVLIVDDDPHIRRIIEFKLKRQGYQVIKAMNGEQGLNLIKSERPDVVISDIMMPKMDGESLCKQADALKAQQAFLTIVMTNRISPDDRKWTKDLQDTQLMEKPFSPSKLLDRIEQYFGDRA